MTGAAGAAHCVTSGRTIATSRQAATRPVRMIRARPKLSASDRK